LNLPVSKVLTENLPSQAQPPPFSVNGISLLVSTNVRCRLSKAEVKPWVDTTQTNAKAKCRSLNTETSDNDIDNDMGDDGTYALISNPEWMAIARNVENIKSNWTSGTVGGGCLFRGNVGNALPCNGPSTDQVDSGYAELGADFGSERNELAKLTLDNGEEI